MPGIQTTIHRTGRTEQEIAEIQHMLWDASADNPVLLKLQGEDYAEPIGDYSGLVFGAKGCNMCIVKTTAPSLDTRELVINDLIEIMSYIHEHRLHNIATTEYSAMHNVSESEAFVLCVYNIDADYPSRLPIFEEANKTFRSISGLQ